MRPLATALLALSLVISGGLGVWASGADARGRGTRVIRRLPRSNVLVELAAPARAKISLRVTVGRRRVCRIQGIMPARSPRTSRSRRRGTGTVVVPRACLLRVTGSRRTRFRAAFQIRGTITLGGKRARISHRSTVDKGCDRLLSPDCVQVRLVITAQGKVRQDCGCCCRCDWDKA